MAVIGTFGSFTTARLGVYASQSALNVTGNNIANINTTGYTRQRLDLVSLQSYGTGRYSNSYNLNIGYGVLADSVSQLRDPFLDIRYRDMNSSLASYEALVDGYSQISDILDEVGMGDGEFGIIEAELSNLVSMLNDRNYNPGSDDFDTIVRSSAQSLANYFNSYADSLAVVKENLTQDLKTDVETVNTILEQIRDLNVQIRDAGIFGDKALELRDARNLLIDELSGFMKIDVRYDMEKVDEFSSVERLNISIANSGTPPIKLVEGIYATQLSMPEKTAMRNPDYDPSYVIDPDNPSADDYKGMKYISEINDKVDPPVYTYTNNPSTTEADGVLGDPALEVNNAVSGADDNRLWMSLAPLVDEKGRYIRDEFNKEVKDWVDLSDTQLFGSLQAKRELITEEGEYASAEDVKFDENANIKRGIPYYQHALDALAQQLAKAFNEANRLDFDQVSAAYVMNAAGEFVDKDGTVIEDKDGTAITGAYFDQLAQDIADGNASEEDIQKGYDLMETLRTEGGQLTEEWSFYRGGVMFSNKGDGNDPTGITAANITISKDWSIGTVRTLHTKQPYVDGKEHSSLDDNIYHMISLMDQKLSYYAGTTVPDAMDGDQAYFKGSFQEMLANMNLTLAMDQYTALGQYNSYAQKTLNLDNSRQSVSGVDLNDEATNMMMFQKSYAAACQLMTTLDSMLDKLINGTI